HTPRRGKEAHQPPAESECIPVAVVEENILTLQLFRTPSYFLEVWKELLKHSTRLSLFWRRLRSEEHTSELQSRFDLVCRLLLEKKKYKISPNHVSSTVSNQ